MKRFLLLLSCYLVAWCSVQASMLQGFSATSMVLASAPAVAPAPSCPAVIKSVAYDKNDGRKVVVSFNAYQSGKVSFNLQGSRTITGLGETSVTKVGIYEASFTLPKGWNTGGSIIICYNGGPCGGTYLPAPAIIDPVTPTPGPDFGTAVAGHISDVRLNNCESTANGLPSSISFDYSLVNAKNPCMVIKQGSTYGNPVAEFKINNTNGEDKTVYFYNCSSLKANTTYSACLYDVDAQGNKIDLDIYRDFKMPEEKHYVYNFEWHYMGLGTNKVCIMPSKNIHPSITKVTIMVERYKNGMKDSYQYTASGDARKDYYFGVSGDYTYIITVSWPNGERKTIQAYICAK